MKIMVAHFVLEANQNIPTHCDLKDFNLRYGRECVDGMRFGDVFSGENVEFVPAIYADAASNGIMKKAAFAYVEQRILATLKANLRDLDGIYLHLHGASEVEEIGSGEHHILREIRKITGPYLPIAIVCDPHGNLCKEYAENATIIRSYRESPHTDINETIAFVAGALLNLLKHRRCIRPCYRKLPLILGGEQSVSTDEPVCSINKYMDEMEKDPRILSASWHVGYIRHDSEVAGCGVVVVPTSGEDQAYAEQKADELAAFVWARRHEFHYTGLTATPEKALSMVLDAPERTVFLTDSGDNVTSGAMGGNTFVLRQVLAQNELHGKHFLFASIHDDESYALLASHAVGDTVSICLGSGLDAVSEKVKLGVTIRAMGRQVGTRLFGESGDFGGCITVAINGFPVDVIVADTNHPFVEPQQAEAAGAPWENYDVVVVKTGYAFPEVKAFGKLCVMSLTDGATLQDTTALPFKRIMRPMYPIDKI